MVKKKEKISVSINKEILSYIDGLVKERSLKNRSVAFEYVAKRSMGVSEVRDAVLFLFKYDLIFFQYVHKGVMFLQQMINFLKEGGIQRVFILSQHPNIEPYLKNINFNGINVIVKYFPEEVYNMPMLYSIKDELEENFFITNGDTLQNFKLSKMVEFFVQSKKLATMLIVQSHQSEKYTSIILEGTSTVAGLVERKQSSSGDIYGGSSIMNKNIFPIINPHKDRIMEVDLFKKIIALKQIDGFFNYGEYIHMPEIYDQNYKERRNKLYAEYEKKHPPS